jgi:hypothetical protein
MVRFVSGAVVDLAWLNLLRPIPPFGLSESANTTHPMEKMKGAGHANQSQAARAPERDRRRGRLENGVAASILLRLLLAAGMKDSCLDLSRCR